MKSVTMLPATSENQTLELTLCVIRHLASVDDKILLHHTISMSLARFDMSAQQSCEKRGFLGRGRKPGPSG
jgi:hypothetical protein